MAHVPDPIIRAFLLADTVYHSQRPDGVLGKKALIGLFNEWNSPVFPFQAQPFVVFTQVTGVTKAHEWTLRYVSQKDQGVIGTFGPMVPKTPTSRNAAMDILMHVHGLVIPEPGTYTFEWFIDDVHRLKDFPVSVYDISRGKAS
jgi:hypothetical protein